MATKMPGSIIEMLKQDHSSVKELFDKFEKTDDEAAREKIIEKAIAALEVHAGVEEKLVYPALREHLNDDELMDEALEEHHVVHVLINELKSGKAETGRRHAKFIVLAENVRHHIKEEEDGMFPKAKKIELDWDKLSSEVEGLRAKLEKK